MRDTDTRPAAPNYTTACVVMFGVNLTWILMAIWAVWGLIAAMALSWLLNKGINAIATARRA